MEFYYAPFKIDMRRAGVYLDEEVALTVVGASGARGERRGRRIGHALTVNTHYSSVAALVLLDNRAAYSEGMIVAETDDKAVEKRIARMYFCDCAIIVFSMAAMWLTLGFVLREVVPLTDDSRVKLVVVISAAVVGIFATGALIAVLAHVRRNRAQLYREDLSHLTKREE